MLIGRILSVKLLDLNPENMWRGILIILFASITSNCNSFLALS